MHIRLYDWPASPFCMKVRAILDYKGLEYERINILGPAWFEVWRRGRIGKVPAGVQLIALSRRKRCRSV